MLAERVAGAVDRRRAGQRQVLDVGAERVGDGALDRVGAFAGALGDHVAGVVDDVGVVAGAAAHRVGAGAAVEHVAAALPVSTLASALPVPLIAAVPVSVRFSTLAASV